jgi:hypothetical protein
VTQEEVGRTIRVVLDEIARQALEGQPLSIAADDGPTGAAPYGAVTAGPDAVLRVRSSVCRSGVKIQVVISARVVVSMALDANTTLRPRH